MLFAPPDFSQTCFAEGNWQEGFLADQIREYDLRNDSSKFKRPDEDILSRQSQG